MDSIEILQRLIAFRTVSSNPNLDLLAFVSELLKTCGISSQLVPSSDGHKANLFATVGDGGGGVMLSGHTDVVPVDGQDWTLPPFTLIES